MCNALTFLTKVVVILLISFHVLVPWSLGSESSVSALLGTWRWLGAATPVKKIIPLPKETYTLSFNADGRFSMKLEINVVNGGYEVEGSSLKTIPPFMMTMAAWMPDSPAPDLIALFENSSGYFFKDGLLYIDTFADGGTLRFEKVPD